MILKIHGDVDHEDSDRDTFVVTEDHYIDYLAGRERARADPAYLMRRIRESDLLFLGYSMRDWNLRVILRQIWAEQGVSTGGWSIQLDPSEIDQRFWARQRIEILDVGARGVGRGDARAARVSASAVPAGAAVAAPGARRIRGSFRTPRPTRSGSSAATSGQRWSRTICAPTGSQCFTARAASARARCSAPGDPDARARGAREHRRRTASRGCSPSRSRRGASTIRSLR